jgi:hypothetical protein
LLVAGLRNPIFFLIVGATRAGHAVWRGVYLIGTASVHHGDLTGRRHSYPVTRSSLIAFANVLAKADDKRELHDFRFREMLSQPGEALVRYVQISRVIRSNALWEEDWKRPLRIAIPLPHLTPSA